MASLESELLSPQRWQRWVREAGLQSKAKCVARLEGAPWFYVVIGVFVGYILGVVVARWWKPREVATGQPVDFCFSKETGVLDTWVPTIKRDGPEDVVAARRRARALRG